MRVNDVLFPSYVKLYSSCFSYSLHREVKGRGRTHLVSTVEGISAEQVLELTHCSLYINYVIYTVYTGIKGLINYIAPY